MKEERRETVDNKFMTESVRKLSNINFQWTKTFYQNNSKTTALFVTSFNGYKCNLVISNNTKENFHGSPRK